MDYDSSAVMKEKPIDKGETLTERAVPGLHDHLFEKLSDMDMPYDVPILDIGCGTGAWLLRLSRAGYTMLHGIDRDLSLFAFQGAHASRLNIDTEVHCSWPYKFGMITAIEMIEHLQNPGRLLEFVQAHLAPGGRLLLTTPNIHSLECRLRFLVTGRLRHFDRYGDPTHVSPVLVDGLTRMLTTHGLAVERRWTYPPQGGGIGSRWQSKISAKLLSTLLPDPMPGDILCFWIRKTTT